MFPSSARERPPSQRAFVRSPCRFRARRANPLSSSSAPRTRRRTARRRGPRQTPRWPRSASRARRSRAPRAAASRRRRPRASRACRDGSVSHQRNPPCTNSGMLVGAILIYHRCWACWHWRWRVPVCPPRLMGSFRRSEDPAASPPREVNRPPRTEGASQPRLVGSRANPTDAPPPRAATPSSTARPTSLRGEGGREEGGWRVRSHRTIDEPAREGREEGGC